MTIIEEIPVSFETLSVSIETTTSQQFLRQNFVGDPGAEILHVSLIEWERRPSSEELRKLADEDAANDAVSLAWNVVVADKGPLRDVQRGLFLI